MNESTLKIIPRIEVFGWMREDLQTSHVGQPGFERAHNRVDDLVRKFEHIGEINVVTLCSDVGRRGSIDHDSDCDDDDEHTGNCEAAK